MEASIKQAGSTLSKLDALAQSGDRVFLTNHGKRVVELVPVRDKVDQRGFGSQKERCAATDHVLSTMGLQTP